MTGPPLERMASSSACRRIASVYGAQRVSSQHVIVCYGNEVQALKELCGLLDIAVVY